MWIASRAFLFWLEARMCLSDQTCRAKQTHTGLLPVKQTFQLFTWFTALSILFLVSRKYDVFFQKVFPRNSVLPIPDIPILRGHRPNWGINNPIISILLFYSNSWVLFQLLFTPATGYRFKSLSDVPAYIIPLSVYTTRSWNKLNYFLTKKWECAS